MNTLISTLIKMSKQVLAEAAEIPFAVPDGPQLEDALHVSKTATAQPDRVWLTPMGAKLVGDKKLPPGAPYTDGEKRFYEQLDSLLSQYNGKKDVTYDPNLSALAQQHYNVDCWQYSGEEFRRTVPDMDKQRMEHVSEFRKPVKSEWFFDLIEKDEDLQQAIQFVFDHMPSVTADDKLDINVKGVFDKKHANGGWPYNRNDRKVDPDTGQTYAQLYYKLAEEAYRDFLKDGNYQKLLSKWNVALLFGRDQGKGRLIIAISRVLTMIIALIGSAEINVLKSNPIFIGYTDPDNIKKRLFEMGRYADKKNAVMANHDQTGFDEHIDPGFVALVGSMRELKAVGSRSKQLAHLRTLAGLKTSAINGMTHTVDEFFGRVFSGEFDTSLCDSWVEGIAGTYCAIKMAKGNLELSAGGPAPYVDLGDDILQYFIRKGFSSEEYSRHMRTLHLVVKPRKYALGAFFLQYRCYVKDGKDIMVYPWPRVVRSCLYQERSKALGKYGWLLSTLMKLNHLIEDKDALDPAVRILFPLDELELGYGMSAKALVNAIKLEDLQARKDKPPSQWTSTFETLNDGDPQKAALFEGESPESDFLTKTLTAIRESVDRCGLKSAAKVNH